MVNGRSPRSGNVEAPLRRVRPLRSALSVLAILAFLGCATKKYILYTGEPTAPVFTIDASGHRGFVSSLLLSRDGRFLVSAGTDRQVLIRELASGATVRAWRGPLRPGEEERFCPAALSADDRYLAVAGLLAAPGDVALYDFRTGAALASLRGHEGEINALAFSPDGNTLASAGDDQTVRLWSLPTGKPLQVLRGHTKLVNALAFSPDGARLASGGNDQTLRLWDARSGKPLRVLSGAGARVNTAAFSPEGRLLVSGQDDRTIRLWDAATGALLKVLGTGEDWAHSLAFTPDGSRLLVADLTGIAVLAVPGGQVVSRFGRSDELVVLAALSADGKTAAVSGLSSDRIELVDLVQGAVVGTLSGRGRPVWSVGFAQDGRSIALGTAFRMEAKDFSAQAFGEEDWSRVTPLERTFRLRRGEAFEVAPGNPIAPGEAFRRAVVRSGAYQLRESDKALGLQLLANGKILREIPSATGLSLTRYTFTMDGRQIVAGGDSGDLALYDRDTGARVRRLVGHTGSVLAVAVSPDGKWLLSGSADQTVRLWDLATGTTLLTLFIDPDGEWVAWTPWGYYTASARGDRYLVEVGSHGERTVLDESARLRFHRPDVVSALLETGDINKALLFAEARRRPGPASPEVAAVAEDPPPQIYVVEPGEDGLRVDRESLRVRAAALSSHLPITDLRVSLNGARVAGLPEGRAKGDPLQREIEVEVTLKPGDNVLTFEAAHAKARSQPLTRHVTYRPAAAARTGGKPNLILLAIGIADYRDPALQLSWATEDARQVAAFFRRQEGRLFARVEVKLLPDGGTRAGRDEISDALDWFERRGEPGDVRLLFLSGHGAVDRHGQFYFLSQDQAADRNPQARGIPWTRLLDSLTAGGVRPILMVDTCHAAAARGGRQALFDLTEAVKLNSAYPGLVTFTASSGTELSLERDEWRHGAFTAALLEGLSGKADGIIRNRREDRRVDTQELGTWLIQRVAELTGDAQHASFDLGATPPLPLAEVIEGVEGTP